MSSTTPPLKVGTLCWTELATPDAKTAKAFYAELFGWDIQEQDMSGFPYNIIRTPSGEQVGGIYEISGQEFQNLPAHWLIYFLVSELDATANKVEALGGAVRVPPSDIPGIGRYCIIQDPTGGIVALFEPL